MNITTQIPESVGEAASKLMVAIASPLAELPADEFVNAWAALAYLFPELHPDHHDDPDGGWPDTLRPIAVEAWRRADSGEIDEDALYPSDAQWCGLYDRMSDHTAEESERRAQLKARRQV